MGMLLRSTPVQLFLCILFAACFGNSLPITAIKACYTISLLFIDIVLFILPIIILSYLFNSLVSIEKKAPILVLSLIGLICLSNATAIVLAYSVGSLIIPCLSININIIDTNNFVEPFFRVPLKHGIRSDFVALSAFLLAYGIVKFRQKYSAINMFANFMLKLQSLISEGLKKAFLPFLPVYVLGFILKMAADGTLSFLYRQYLPVFVLNIGVSFVYVMVLYKLVSIDYKPLKTLIVNMLPAGVTGFLTMSGTVTIPVTLSCAEKNVEHVNLSRIVIPTSSNMHMIGDDITITITALAVLTLHHKGIPNFIDFLPFVLGFCLAKLACVGIAGASLLVVLPVLKEHLGFSAEMVSLITTLYVLHDSFGTFHNVMGNGAFAILVERVFKKIGILPENVN